MSLEPGEILYREVSASYWTLGQPTELIDSVGGTRFVAALRRDWGWCQTLSTSHRLVTRLAADGGRLISNSWSSTGGVQVDLLRDFVTLDDRTNNWRGAYGGPAVAVISVGAVAAVLRIGGVGGKQGVTAAAGRAASGRVAEGVTGR